LTNWSKRSGEEDPVDEREANAIEAVVGWMDAMRRGDLEAISGWLDPQVTWRGVPDEPVCRNRDDVLEMLRDSLTPCPEDPATYEVQEGLRGAEAVELVTSGEDTVVLGAKVPGLGEVGGIPLEGQLFNVFRVRQGRIVEVADYALREEALQAAGATAPSWA
jgi:ketosteroid isomerase-like protein